MDQYQYPKTSMQQVHRQLMFDVEKIKKITEINLLPNSWKMQLSEKGDYLVIIYHDADIQLMKTSDLNTVRWMTTEALLCPSIENIVTFSPDSKYIILQQTATKLITIEIKEKNQQEYTLSLASPGFVNKIDEQNRFYLQQQKIIKIYSLMPLQLLNTIDLMVHDFCYIPLRKIFFIANKKSLVIKQGKNQKTLLRWLNERNNSMNYYQQHQFVLGACNMTNEIVLWHAGLHKRIRSIKFQRLQFIQQVLLQSEFIVLAVEYQEGMPTLKQINCLQYLEEELNFLNIGSQAIISVPKVIVLQNQEQGFIYEFK